MKVLNYDTLTWPEAGRYRLRVHWWPSVCQYLSLPIHSSLQRHRPPPSRSSEKATIFYIILEVTVNNCTCKVFTDLIDDYYFVAEI